LGCSRQAKGRILDEGGADPFNILSARLNALKKKSTLIGILPDGRKAVLVIQRIGPDAERFSVAAFGTWELQEGARVPVKLTVSGRGGELWIGSMKHPEDAT
jgi:hypothetical protein